MVAGATLTGQEAAWALAPLIAGRPRVRWGHWNGRLRKWEYRARDERDLTDRVPNVPAAVMIYSAEGLAHVFVADVDVELRAQGFVPQAFVATKTWPLAPVQWADRDAPTDEAHARQLVEADMLYVRDLTHLDDADTVDDEALKHLALVMHHVYDQHGVALLALRELIRRGALDPSAEAAYRDHPA